MWVGKLSWKMKFPISDDNFFPTIYSWSRFSFLFFSFLSFFLFSFQHQPGVEQKEMNDFIIAPMLRVWKSVSWSRLHCMALRDSGLGGSAHSPVLPMATVGANAGRLASRQERWKASSNVITDGLSVPFELFTDWVNDYRLCVSWPGARNSYPPVRYYQRALPCLAGVLPKHLTEMPTQKEECSECALSPEARARKLEYQAWIRCWGGQSFQDCSGLGKGSRSALRPEEPDSSRSSLGGVGK